MQDQTGRNIEDFQLLRRFVEEGSQTAFAQLVERRLSFVYSVCRREVGEANLAEDVTQAVFLIFGREGAQYPRRQYAGRLAVQYRALCVP